MELSELEHFGVKGMKWGVIRERAAGGDKRAQRKLARGDKKFVRKAGSSNVTFKVFAAGVKEYNKRLPAFNNKPAYKNADFTRDTPLRRKYYKEGQDLYLESLEKAANDLGTNPSGTKKYGVIDLGGNRWDITIRDIKHADGVVGRVQLILDSLGHIVGIENIETEMEQSDDVGEFLEHFGIKGMKWGVRRQKKTTQVGNVTTVQKEGRRVRAKGGKRLVASEDAVKAAVARQKAKKSTTDSLSNQELQALVNRMNLEQQYSRLGGQSGSRLANGLKVAKNIIGLGKAADEGFAAAKNSNFASGFVKAARGGGSGFSGKVIDGSVA